MPSPNQPKTIKFVLLGEIEVEKNDKSKPGEPALLVTKRRAVVPSKKNQKEAAISQSGKAFIRPNLKYIEWKKTHGIFFDQLHEKLLQQGIRLPIVRCDIKMLSYYPDSSERDNHNKFETIADMLKEHQIIGSDSFKVFHDTTLRGVVKRDNPRTEVYITIIEPTHKHYEWDYTSDEYRELQRKKKAIRSREYRAKKK